MSPSKTAKRVAFDCCEQVATMLEEAGPGNEEEEEEDISPTVESSSSSSSLSSSATSTSTFRRELMRLESLVRCHVQHQWHLSIENYSKLRKRQSSALSTPDAEVASTSPSSDCSACPHSGDPGSAASIAQFNKEVQEAWSAIDFGHKPSLWRKTIRSVILRLRGQEQHKDVYVMPQHLRDQLKQMYVY
ncbi:uncharacterized protein LOC130703385 isoform X3 [Daphnia carinata]|uniref:uncharacterized protein LOC130703385 isoform X3 n=1 Tax=Daphnia carinata TaxID=120202 RepID=UPI00257BB53B|nr:uncharacterized protein LOC130703385 isoform X3 [Daphnia carinata]